MCYYLAVPQMVGLDDEGYQKIMAWANPNNINTANLDANTDSPSLARADIKTAFDELTNVANNQSTTYTPSLTASQGTVTIAYTTQEGRYVQMGGIVFLDVLIHANILYSDAPGSIARLTMNLPVAPSITNTTYKTGNNFNILLADGVETSTWPTGLQWDEDIRFWGKTTATSTDLEFRLIRDASPSAGEDGRDIDIPDVRDFNGNINSGDGTMALKVQGWYWA